MSKFKVVEVRPSGGKNIAEVFWEDGHVSRFHTIWLRCNCRCSVCCRTIVGQALVERSKLSCQLLVSEATIHDEGAKINFKLAPETNHVTVMTSDWLRSACYCDACISEMLDEREMKFHLPSESQLPVAEFEQLDTDKGMFELIGTVFDRGFVVVENVPREDGSVVKTGKRMAPLIGGVCGEKFDVVDVQSTEHAAYTSSGLPFHADQCIYEAPEGILLLHALRFDDVVEGGNSLLVDMFHVIDILRKQSPDDFRVLSRVPIAYATIDYNRRDPAHVIHRKPIILLDYDDKVVGYSWNPGTEQTLRVHEDDVEPFYRAYVKLQKLIDDPKNQFKFRLRSGDMLVLHNRRMAHSRDAYKTNGGHRRLQGTYVNIEDLRSKYVVLGRKLNRPVVAPKIGNCSSI
uniref:Gamma-butyrobetaine dioxygenase-like n=1 Tax=Phallusia mammillata TaxID=59560 RepID=A0A6F9D7M9_9ASCI|nr:gamma-butyrobetaine dioxygenase-like [Phallusia mammillata]